MFGRSVSSLHIDLSIFRHVLHGMISHHLTSSHQVSRDPNVEQNWMSTTSTRIIGALLCYQAHLGGTIEPIHVSMNYQCKLQQVRWSFRCYTSLIYILLFARKRANCSYRSQIRNAAMYHISFVMITVDLLSRNIRRMILPALFHKKMTAWAITWFETCDFCKGDSQSVHVVTQSRINIFFSAIHWSISSSPKLCVHQRSPRVARSANSRDKEIVTMITLYPLAVKLIHPFSRRIPIKRKLPGSGASYKREYIYPYILATEDLRTSSKRIDTEPLSTSLMSTYWWSSWRSSLQNFSIFSLLWDRT